MEKFEQKNSSRLEIETVKTPEGNRVSCCPERGGIITSLKLQDKELLYLDQETFQDQNVNVKGGIPILFPNAGPIPDEIKTDELKNLKQHGFARESKWIYKKKQNGFEEILNSDQKTRDVFPYDFELSIDGSFKEDNSFTITQVVKNLEKEKEIPISSGFHPYFKVSSDEKKNIEFNFKGGEKVKEEVEKWETGKTIKAISVENPNTPIEIRIPGWQVPQI